MQWGPAALMIRVASTVRTGSAGFRWAAQALAPQDDAVARPWGQRRSAGQMRTGCLIIAASSPLTRMPRAVWANSSVSVLVSRGAARGVRQGRPPARAIRPASRLR